MLLANSVLTASSLGHRVTITTQDNEEVHSVNTDTRIVLDTQINMFLDSEPEVSGVREVALSQLVFFHFQSSLQQFLGLLASHGAVDSDLFVSSDTKRTNSVSGFRRHRRLTSQLLQHFRGSSQPEQLSVKTFQSIQILIFLRVFSKIYSKYQIESIKKI